VAYWICAFTAPNSEARAERHLRLNGFTDVYLPRLRERRLRAGRRIEVVTPMFPRYVFIAIEAQWYRVKSTVGIASVLMNGVGPQVVRDELIAAIMEREQNGLMLPENALRPGDRVRILSGPFREQVAVLASLRPRERVEVLLALLGSQRRVILRADGVELVRE
jgi:transcriptional antiterminator RfaH